MQSFLTVCFLLSSQNDIVDSIRDFANLEDRTPLLVLMDVPEQSIYVHPEGEITKDVVKTVVSDYKADKLTMKKIR